MYHVIPLCLYPATRHAASVPAKLMALSPERTGIVRHGMNGRRLKIQGQASTVSSSRFDACRLDAHSPDVSLNISAVLGISEVFTVSALLYPTKFLDFSKFLIFLSPNPSKPSNASHLSSFSAFPEIKHFSDTSSLKNFDLSFTSHINKITSAAFKTFAFIYRTSKFSKKANIFRLLYCALVRPRLEYRSVIWSPYHRYLVNMIGGIQHRFLRSTARVSGLPFLPWSNHFSILDRLNLTTFQRRPLMLDILFAHKMLNGIINKPDISSQFHLCVSQPSIRLCPFLKQKLHSTSYDRHNCTNGSIASANLYCEEINFFCSFYISRRS